MKRVTQREVAEKAGVSRATVSYVLNRSEKSKVPISPETRRRVLAAVTALGYEPDASAQTLRSGKSKTVGVLVPDMKNPHFWQLLSGIEREGHRQGYTLLLFHSGLVKAEEDTGLRELARKRIDGLILISSFPPSWTDSTRSLMSSRRPVVDLSNVDSPFDRVVSDYHEGTRQLMKHLLSLGHQRIAFVYGTASPEVGLDRLDPYEEALSEHDIPVDSDLVVRCGPTMEEGYDAARRLINLRDRPTAIVAINDILALAVIRAALDLGVAVPEELSVAGFDDIPFAKLLHPRLTSVHRDTEREGEMAFRLLMERLEKPEMPLRTERLDARLIVRESTGPSPRTVQSAL